MDEKLPRSIDNEFIRLRQWGGMSGLRFIDGGEAVIHLCMPEIHRLVEALLELEQNSVDPDTEVIDALKILEAKYQISDDSRLINVEAIVPIAANGVNFECIVDTEDPLLEERRRLNDRRRKIERELEGDDDASS